MINVLFCIESKTIKKMYVFIQYCNSMNKYVTFKDGQSRVGVCVADFRRWLPRWDHQRVHSVSAAGSFLTGVEDVFGHTAGWRWRKPGEESAWICCETFFFLFTSRVFKQTPCVFSKMPESLPEEKTGGTGSISRVWVYFYLSITTITANPRMFWGVLEDWFLLTHHK